MKIGLIHNEYGVYSGEEAMFYRIADLLRKYGHDVGLFTKTSRDIGNTLLEKSKTFFSGIYSAQSRKEIRSFIGEFQPDIVQIQNLYPLISPSVLLELEQHHIPIVMRCANYRLICPNGLLMSDGNICHRCLGGREWWCCLKNCEKSIPKSFGYALRHYVARKQGWFHRLITRYYTQTEFQKRILAQHGFEESKIDVVPNMITPQENKFFMGSYVGYLGRISEEKGIRTLLEAAKQLRQIPFKLAGAISMPDFDPNNLPENVEYVGFVEKEEKEKFIREAGIIAVPSVCYEGFPSSILEAMNSMTPVICSEIGGLSEVVRHGVTGLCFKPGSSSDLCEKIQLLFNDNERQQMFAERAKIKLGENHTEQAYYNRLISLYQDALLQKENTYDADEQLLLLDSLQDSSRIGKYFFKIGSIPD